jgi:hypothetical protein
VRINARMLVPTPVTGAEQWINDELIAASRHHLDKNPLECDLSTKLNL